VADKGIIARVIEWVATPLIESRIAEANPAAGTMIDPDEDLFRRLSGSRRDLNPIMQERAQSIALYLWRQNPMAHRLTEMVADFVVGDGITVKAVDENVQAVLDEIWHDPAMHLDQAHRDLVRDQSIYGELCLRAFVNETSGRTRFGLVLSERIDDILPDPDNAFLDGTLVLKPKGGSGEGERVEIARYDDEADPSSPRWRGEAFYFGINRVHGQHRGTPDLLAPADYVDGYDQLLFNALERSGLINAFVWDVTLTGSTKTDVQKWVSEHGDAPPPGAVRAHNEKEVWQAVNPGLGNADMMALGRATKNMALGGLGAPEAWFAEGDSANRATLAEQSDPTYRMITRRQADTAAMFHCLLDFALGKAIERGRLPAAIDRTFSVNLPEPSMKDTGKITTALVQLTQALAAAKDAEWISARSARAMFLMLAGQIGMDLKPEDEEAQIETEAEAAEAEEPEAVVPGEEYGPLPPQMPTNGTGQAPVGGYQATSRG